MRGIVVVVSIVCLATIVNARAGSAANSKANKSVSAKEFVSYMAKYGDSASVSLEGSRELLDIPGEGPDQAMKGDSTDRGELPGKEVSTAMVFLSDNGKPSCLVIEDGEVKIEDGHSLSYRYRFDSSGSLHRAVEMHSEVDANGDPIEGTTTKSSAVDVNDPAVRRQAKHLLDYWLKRPQKLKAKKDAQAVKAKQTK